jgi:hypothetical protein
MTRQLREHTGYTLAQDSEGNQYRIHEWTRFSESLDSAGVLRRTTIAKELLCHGAQVSRVAKGRYLIGETQLLVTTDDPHAP